MAEGADDFAAGRIAMSVQYAIAAVSSFAGKQQLRSFAIERSTPFDEPFDCRRRFFDQRSHRFPIAETIACNDRVVLMQIAFVIVI